MASVEDENVLRQDCYWAGGDVAVEIGAPGILAQAPERQHSVGVPDRVLEGPPCVFAILHSVDVGKRLLTGYLHTIAAGSLVRTLSSFPSASLGDALIPADASGQDCRSRSRSRRGSNRTCNPYVDFDELRLR